MVSNYVFIFTPIPGDSWSNLTCAYFWNGLVQPPNSFLFFYHKKSTIHVDTMVQRKAWRVGWDGDGGWCRLMMVAEKGISLRTKIQNNMHDNGGCGCWCVFRGFGYVFLFFRFKVVSRLYWCFCWFFWLFDWMILLMESQTIVFEPLQLMVGRLPFPQLVLARFLNHQQYWMLLLLFFFFGGGGGNMCWHVVLHGFLTYPSWGALI